MVIVRYESSYKNSFVSFVARPFEVGYRHLRVAFCNGKKETLVKMAKERMIYRAEEVKNYNLTITHQVVHLVVGLLEILGYCTIVVPFAVAFFDERANRRAGPNNLSPLIKTHFHEWGSVDEDWNLIEPERRNPYGPLASTDDFYKDASWMIKKNK